MKKPLLLLLTFLILSSCGSNSNIITSKNEAIKRNQYYSSTNSKREIIKDNSATKPELKKEDIVSNSGAKIISKNVKNEIVSKIQTYLGSPYLEGGATKNGFDCSGLIFATCKEYNITLPRTSLEMSTIGTILEISDVKKGDLIFFKTNGNNKINHVGMVVEVLDDQLKFIHSSTNKGVIISSTKDSYYNKTFAQLNRVIE